MKGSKEGRTRTKACPVYPRTRKEGQRAQRGATTGAAEQERGSVTAGARPHGTVRTISKMSPYSERKRECKRECKRELGSAVRR